MRIQLSRAHVHQPLLKTVVSNFRNFRDQDNLIVVQPWQIRELTDVELLKDSEVQLE
jgi:hypothetical protein